MTAATSSAVPPRARPGKGLNIALWVLQIALALMFFLAGGHKLTGDPQMVGLFDAIGIGQWFRFLTGGLEVAGGALLLVPRASGVGAGALAGVMVGAVVTHLVVLHNAPTLPFVLLVALAFVAWGRRSQIVSLLERLR